MSEPINVSANEARRRPIRIRPGLLVSLSVRVEGGVEYEREDLGTERIGAEEEGEAVEWKTLKKVADVEEYRAASVLRGRVRSLVAGACVWTPFGIVCPLDQEAQLNERIAEGHRMVGEFNLTAGHSRVRFPEPLRGRIDDNDSIARNTLAIREEIHELVGELQVALASGQVETIRDVAQKATQMGKLLEDGTEARSALDRAVKESRRVATELVKRLEEGAEATAEVLAGANVKLISTARLAFEDDELGEITDVAPSLPSAAVTRFGNLGEEYVETAQIPEPEPPDPEPPPAAPAVVDANAAAAEFIRFVEAADASILEQRRPALDAAMENMRRIEAGETPTTPASPPPDTPGEAYDEDEID